MKPGGIIRIIVPDVSMEHGHVSCWDFETLEIILSRVGFKNIRKTAFRKGADRRLVSLYVEGVKL